MDLQFTQGATERLVATIREADGTTLKNLSTLAEAWFTVKSVPDILPDAQAQMQLRLSEGDIVAGDPGELIVLIAPARTQALTPSILYYWDLRLQFADGTVSNPSNCSGRLSVTRSITISPH